MINFPDAPTLDQTFVVNDISWRWDGGKWVVSDTRHGLTNTIVPTEGMTITLTEVKTVYINNSATLASLIIKLPQTAAIGDPLEISFRRPVNALAVQNWAGVLIPDGPVNAYGPGAALKFQYVDHTIQWVYWK